MQLVNQFASAALAGKSSVRQMIMGAGKTTVIAPILALMLADGASLVFNVMPAALLEQSLGIMRNAFSSVIQKRVYPFHFDRLSKVAPPPSPTAPPLLSGGLLRVSRAWLCVCVPALSVHLCSVRPRGLLLLCSCQSARFVTKPCS